jgi:MFS family permease
MNEHPRAPKRPPAAPLRGSPMATASVASALANPTFRTLWLASLVSNAGALIQQVGAAWQMTAMAPSPGMVALVQFAASMPIVMFSMVAGVLADSFDRRAVQIVAQLFMLVMSLVLALLAYLNWLSPWSLLALTFLVGCGTALHNPSWQASMGDLVDRKDLPAAVSLNGVGFNLMRCVGPAVGGLIVASVGAAAAFFVNAVSYLSLIGALVSWRSNAPPRRLPREPFVAALATGLTYAANSPDLVKLIVRGFLYGSAGSIIQALLPIYTRAHLESTATGYGILLGCFGFGGLAGAFGRRTLSERLSSEGIVRLAFAAQALACAILALTNAFTLAAVALFVSGLFWVVALSLFNATVQLSTSRWVVGRLMSIYQTAVFGGMALGSAFWGAVADTHGMPSAFLAAGAVLLGGAALGRLIPVPTALPLDLDPLNRFQEPAVKLPVEALSAPITIMVRYEINEADVDAFLAAMQERKRIRLRDGARHWSLLRDVEAPEQWTETYRVPSWTDYVRHNERRTQSDAQVIDRIRALHKGAAPPTVRRFMHSPPPREAGGGRPLLDPPPP